MHHNHLWHIIVISALGGTLIVLLTIIMHLMDAMRAAAL